MDEVLRKADHLSVLGQESEFEHGPLERTEIKLLSQQLQLRKEKRLHVGMSKYRFSLK